MRHIGFDESSVLREFARIASEKGLVKVAQEPAPGAAQEAPAAGKKPGPAAPPAGKPKFDALLGKYPALAGLAGGKKPNPQAVYNQAMKFFPAAQAEVGQLAGYAELAKPLLDQVTQYLLPYVPKEQAARFQSQLSGFAKAPKPEREVLMPADDDMSAEATTHASNVKNAKDEGAKNYGVTDETGEQLVEKAHPGGGTKTELTHSKTDENLVETIVEQQEKDLEVARKAPKGTYAALANLHNTLSKMGHKDKLTGLEVLMEKVATVDEVVGHTLITLADHLDDLGHAKAANAVDELLKKKRLKSQ